MATVTLTFTDDEDGCSVNIHMAFSPAIRGIEKGTPAQQSALAAFEWLSENSAQATPGQDKKS